MRHMRPAGSKDEAACVVAVGAAVLGTQRPSKRARSMAALVSEEAMAAVKTTESLYASSHAECMLILSPCATADCVVASHCLVPLHHHHCLCEKH